MAQNSTHSMNGFHFTEHFVRILFVRLVFSANWHISRAISFISRHDLLLFLSDLSQYLVTNIAFPAQIHTQSLTRSISIWSRKSVSANVSVAIHVMFARSSCVTRSLTANECTSSFCENVVTVSQPKRRMNAIRAKLWDESGATVRKKYGNSRRSLSAGDVEPNDTCKYKNKQSKFQLMFHL